MWYTNHIKVYADFCDSDTGRAVAEERSLDGGDSHVTPADAMTGGKGKWKIKIR